MSLLHELNTLETAGLIRLAMIQPELEYLFRHALVQDAAYGSLLKKDRKRLHLSVGQSLERLYPDRVEEIASTLALHFEKAEQHEKAIRYFMLAGDRARASFANNEAIQFYQSALTQIEKFGQQPDLRCQLHEALGELLNLIGQRETARQYFTRALAMTAEPIAQARLYRKTALSFVDERNYPQAEENFANGEELLKRTSATGPTWWHEVVQNQLDRFWMYYFQNQTDKVEKIVQELQPWVEANGNPLQKARFYMGLTQLNLRKQRFVVTSEDIVIAYKALDAAQASSDLVLQTEMRFGYGFTLLWYGSWSEAETELGTVITLSKQTGNITILARALTYLVVLHRLRKDIPKLRALLPELSQVLQTSGLKEYVPYITVIEAWFAWRANRFDEAKKLAQETLAYWYGPVPFQWFARWLLLSMAFMQENLSAAIEEAKAMLAPTQQKWPDDVTVALEAAIKAEATGQLETAREPLAEALKLATERGYL